MIEEGTFGAFQMLWESLNLDKKFCKLANESFEKF